MPEIALSVLDCLVFSSHKTGTQTITRTLNASGIRAGHCHGLGNIGVAEGDFADRLAAYAAERRRRLRVISIFREPMERHVSSFFQAHGTRPLRTGEAADPSETILCRHPVEELQRRFLVELEDRSLIGYAEALHSLCRELDKAPSALLARRETDRWVHEGTAIELFVCRFDDFFRDFEPMLAGMVGAPVRAVETNIGERKWYGDIYRAFARSLRVPRRILLGVYEDKRDIIETVCGEGFDAVVARARARYEE